MKDNREFIDSIYKKAREYNNEPEVKKRPSFIKNSFLKISAAGACCACIILGVVLVKQPSSTSPIGKEEQTNLKNMNLMRERIAPSDLETQSGQEDVCVTVTEILNGEIVCHVINKINSGFEDGETINIKVPEQFDTEINEKLLLSVIREANNELQYVEGSACHYSRTEENADIYVSDEGTEYVISGNAQE